jgi:hypothetical protein
VRDSLFMCSGMFLVYAFTGGLPDFQSFGEAIDVALSNWGWLLAALGVWGVAFTVKERN